ncbi:hypothetical protein PROFUN_05172 [Planoprotostelium fungivorum]|uniref:Serine-threonine/tyrosine-protein kinase catalytic domain-containing protein n=1 Tax=Planoprotostelium fungivorum TaxID=1890364 RepID=A0A2P6NRF0_9EUKA|nr:hypothetical protein PROFUN_05172 [Planoprotostelium fungivorum]
MSTFPFVCYLLSYPSWRYRSVSLLQVKCASFFFLPIKRHHVLFNQPPQNLRAYPHVVSFVGLTFPPQPLSLITEFCAGGAVDSYIAQNDPPLSQPFGMLHLHADLAVRNILLTGHREIKVADFGMSRTRGDDETAGKTQSNVGPLKWLLRPSYTKSIPKNRISSVMAEILTGQEPYPQLSGIEVAIGVTTKGLRLQIPPQKEFKLARLMILCWATQPQGRPDFILQICSMLGVNESDDQPTDRTEKVHYDNLLINPTSFSALEDGNELFMITEGSINF